jgi:hypothetical protein
MKSEAAEECTQVYGMDQSTFTVDTHPLDEQAKKVRVERPQIDKATG